MNIIHVGYPKAGSTSLQRNCFAWVTDHLYVSRKSNGASEEAAKVYDAISGAVRSGSDEKAEAARLRLKELAVGRDVLYSDERILMPAGPSNVALKRRARLTKLVFGENTKVVIMIREPVAQLVSLYIHVARAKALEGSASDETVQPLGAWLDEELAKAHNVAGHPAGVLFFGRVAEAYVEQFGRANVQILFFDEMTKKGSEFYRDLPARLGFVAALPDAFPQQNATSTASGAEKATQILNAIPGYSTELSETDIGRIHQIVAREAGRLHRATGRKIPLGWLPASLASAETAGSGAGSAAEAPDEGAGETSGPSGG